MKRVGRAALWLSTVVLCANVNDAAAQCIPGQIPNVGTYRGSMEQQRRDAESARQNAPQPQPSYTAPSSSGGYSAPAGPAAPQINWAARPPLPAARNPLLGRWQPRELNAEQISAEAGGGIFGQIVGLIGPDLAADACNILFGGAPVEFRADTMVSQDGEGHRVVTKVAYRADGEDVVALPQGGRLFDVLRFGFDGHNKAVGNGCPLSRIGGVTTASTGPAGAARAAPPPVAQDSVVTLQVGAAAPGRFVPIAGANYLLKDNPDAALAKAGFPSVEAWLKTCKTDSKSCVAAMQAMTGQALATVKTDAAGNAALPPMKPGNYYLFGLAPYEGKSLIWHRPVGVSPGPNNVFLDQTNATAG